MMDADDGYRGDDEHGNDDGEDSFENMPVDGIAAHVNTALGRQVLNRRGYFQPKRTYAQNVKRYKANWRDFIECVTGEMAWRSLEPSTPVCTCENMLLLPAVSLTGTNFPIHFFKCLL